MRTIDFGIDLGTTNSAIARLDGVHTQMIRNAEGAEHTPSAVRIAANGGVQVGNAAKSRCETDRANTAIEFKLLMGLPEERLFEASGLRMTPPQLSAEILKSLRADAERAGHEDMPAAVITVPADFTEAQCHATTEAARLAGFQHMPLLQEPTAAAYAYGFQSDRDNVFWLVYDYGGGTFDAAVIHLLDGEFIVLRNSGDNHLGGKLIDWDIVEQHLIPALRAQAAEQGRTLTDFSRSNPRWAQAIAKLKHHAEQAKIETSIRDWAEIDEPYFCEADDGRMVAFKYVLERPAVDRVAEPYVARTLTHVRRVLEDRRLGLADLEKIILVGGTTLLPYVRARLSALGRPLEYSIDPITVVARGAAIFAGTRQIPSPAPQAPAESFALVIEQPPPIGPEIDPFCAGKVIGPPGVELEGYTIQFVNADTEPEWRGFQVPLDADGTFETELWAEKGRENTLTIELRDSTGTRVPTRPESIPYIVGNVAEAARLPRNIGIALQGNQMEWLVVSGSTLPARQRCTLRTTHEVNTGADEDVLLIPVMSGEYPRADRNRRIGTLTIRGDQLTRDVPAGAEVDLMIAVDESRRITTKAYITIVDEEFEDVIQLAEDTAPRAAELRKPLEQANARLKELSDRSMRANDPTADDLLERVEDGKLVTELEQLVEAADTDPEVAVTCTHRLLELEAALDDVQAALDWPQLVDEAEKMIEQGEGIVEELGTASHQRTCERIAADARAAILARDSRGLERRMDALRVVVMEAMDEAGVLEPARFESLQEMADEMTDQARAQRLVNQGHQALTMGDMNTLAAVNQQLSSLLPPHVPPPDPVQTSVKLG